MNEDCIYIDMGKVSDEALQTLLRAEGTHIEKAKGALNGLKDILKKESLNETDKEIAKYLYNDLNDALKTTRTGK
ncbi:MAG: hypothetical protein IPI37_10415 [Bacteroidales bacterium]|nr:hypothetical protein [Bacteroidales bacterium]